MSFRTRCNGALAGAVLFTIGAPLIFLDLRRNAEKVISDDLSGSRRSLVKRVLVAGSTLPVLTLMGVSALLYPVLGWLAAPVTLALACAVGAALGAVLFDLRQPAPLGTPGNPRPMPGDVELDCANCGGDDLHLQLEA